MLFIMCHHCLHSIFIISKKFTFNIHVIYVQYLEPACCNFIKAMPYSRHGAGDRSAFIELGDKRQSLSSSSECLSVRSNAWHIGIFSFSQLRWRGYSKHMLSCVYKTEWKDDVTTLRELWIIHELVVTMLSPYTKYQNDVYTHGVYVSQIYLRNLDAWSTRKLKVINSQYSCNYMFRLWDFVKSCFTCRIFYL